MRVWGQIIRPRVERGRKANGNVKTMEWQHDIEWGSLDRPSRRQHDIVIATGRGRNGIGQGLADRVIFGIDDAQGGIAVLVLQRPDLAGHRIELQTIDIAADLIGVVDFAGMIIFDDGAVARQTRGVGTVGISYPDVAIR
jgi:hypothetical protein